MKIQIALSATGNDSSIGNSSYAEWESRMKGAKDYNHVGRLDSNKMAAYDNAGVIIDTFAMPVSATLTPQGTDTLDGKQATFPSDKTGNDVKIDINLEKGA